MVDFFLYSKSIEKKNKNSAVLIELLSAFYFAFKNRQDIKNGNFTAYNEKFNVFKKHNHNRS